MGQASSVPEDTPKNCTSFQTVMLGQTGRASAALIRSLDLRRREPIVCNHQLTFPTVVARCFSNLAGPLSASASVLKTGCRRSAAHVRGQNSFLTWVAMSRQTNLLYWTHKFV